MSPLKPYSMKRRQWSRLGTSSLSLLWLLACVSAGLWIMLGRNAPTPGVTASPAAVQPASVVDSTAATPAEYRPIEQLRVGQRVVTPGTYSAKSLPTQVDQSTWKSLTLQAERSWPDGTRDTIEVQTLQPPSWLILHDAKIGGRVPIPLDLREMGLPPMSAQVLAVEPCPPIGDGPGRVVLTTINHLNSFLFDLKVHGERGPPQLIQVTGWHKLYSEDRQAWTSVCELKVGEALRGREGPLAVASLVRHPGTIRVYNLTVEDEHQYYVCDAELLAHNAACTPTVGSGNAYSVAYEMTMGRPAVARGTRYSHFSQANESLFSAMDSDPAFADSMRQMMPDIDSIRGTAGHPQNWVWNHLASSPGTMQLVPSVQHWSSNPLWSMFHPLVNGKNVGGFKLWGHLY